MLQKRQIEYFGSKRCFIFLVNYVIDRLLVTLVIV